MQARLVRLGLALVVGLLAGGAAAQAAGAAPFQRGDVFLLTADGVRVYSPGGVFRRTLPDTAGARAICLERDGRRIVLPGAGLLDGSGTLLPSAWAAATNADRCAVDASGHVYVSSRNDGYAITKYAMDGTPGQRYDIPEPQSHSLALDLAPDECTLYYGSWGISSGSISRLDGCRGEFGSPFTSDGFVDDLRVLPDWRVVVTDDAAGALFDDAGQVARGYNPPGPNGDSFRTVSLDPDGSSFWVCCTWSSPTTLLRIFRFDIETGDVLSDWGVGEGISSTTAAVYGAPLIGHASLGDGVVAGAAGTATAYSSTARASGKVTRLQFFADASTTAARATVGIYTDRNKRPDARVAQATVANVRGGSWNSVIVPSEAVRDEKRYWIAVLAPRGGGTLNLRDSERGGQADTSSQRNLAGLPPRWNSSRGTSPGSISAYGS
jgi:hypothetical protein